MNRARFLTLAGAIGFAALLSGCTSFAPVYGDPQGSGMQTARFNFAAPGNRLEQIILNRLRTAFPNVAGPGDPVLAVSASASSPWAGYSNAMGDRAPIGMRVTATVTISKGDEELFSVTRFADTTYQGGGVSPAAVASSGGAAEMAAKSAAESLRAGILAGYRAPPSKAD